MVEKKLVFEYIKNSNLPNFDKVILVEDLKMVKDSDTLIEFIGGNFDYEDKILLASLLHEMSDDTKERLVKTTKKIGPRTLFAASLLLYGYAANKITKACKDLNWKDETKCRLVLQWKGRKKQLEYLKKVKSKCKETKNEERYFEKINEKIKELELKVKEKENKIKELK